MPPLDEDVLILYKDKESPLTRENLYYAIARRMIWKLFPTSEGFENWSTYTDYQGYYEVVYWARLYDMPHLKEGEE